MELAKATRILREHEADLKKMGVKALFMFGSTVRGEQCAGSDVDLFFDYDTGSMDLYRLMDIKNEAAKILECKTDIMTRDSIHPLIRSDVELSAFRVF